MVRRNLKKRFVHVGNAFSDVDECKLQKNFPLIVCTITCSQNVLIGELFFFLIGKDGYV